MHKPDAHVGALDGWPTASTIDEEHHGSYDIMHSDAEASLLQHVTALLAKAGLTGVLLPHRHTFSHEPDLTEELPLWSILMR